MKSATHPPAPPTTPTSEALLEIANRIAGIDGDESLAPSLIAAAHALAKELRAISVAVASAVPCSIEMPEVAASIKEGLQAVSEGIETGLHDIAEALREVRQ